MSTVPQIKFKTLKRTPERIHQRNVKENHFAPKKKEIHEKKSEADS